MAGYIGSKIAVTQVDGYNRTEADAEFVDVTGDTMTGDLNFGDNDKAIFGASSDLQIYHDGGNSIIHDAGAGVLKIRATDFRLSNAGNTADYMHCTDGADVELFYNGSIKLQTTSTGVNVTGTMSTTSSANALEFVGLNDTDTGMRINDTNIIKFILANSEEFRMEPDGDFHADGDVIAYSTTISDPRLKTDIQKIEGALDKLCTLSGYTFTYTPDGKESAGVLSTEVAEVLPSAIKPKKLPLKTGDDETVYDTVQYDQLHGLLIEAIKELREEVADLKAKIEG